MKLLQPSSDVHQFISDHELGNIFDIDLLDQLQVHYYDTNEQIIEDGTEVKYLYLVISGEAGVAPSSLEGRSGLLDYILPLDIVGDLEYFASTPYVHSVIALSPCYYLAIPIHLIVQKLNSNIHFYKFICVNMANKMNRTSKRYSRSILLPLKNQVAKYLYDRSIAEESMNLRFSTKNTAERFGVSTRHLRRVMANLADKNIIERARVSIKIIDIDTLGTYAKV